MYYNTMSIHRREHYSFMTTMIGICLHLDGRYKQKTQAALLYRGKATASPYADRPPHMAVSHSAAVFAYNPFI